MYSFAPTPDLTDIHTGLYIGLAFVGVLGYVMYSLCEKIGHVIASTLVLLLIIGTFVSGSFSENRPKNTQVIGTFVSFQPEGYRESFGKTRSDHHYVYVVYSVNGQNILLNGSTGSVYPKEVILYKN